MIKRFVLNEWHRWFTPIREGDVYEDCAYHPVLCTEVHPISTVSGKADYDLVGFSLLDGSGPRSCSWAHCGVRKLTAQQVAFAVAHRDIILHGSDEEVMRLFLGPVVINEPD